MRALPASPPSPCLFVSAGADDCPTGYPFLVEECYTVIARVLKYELALSAFELAMLWAIPLLRTSVDAMFSFAMLTALQVDEGVVPVPIQGDVHTPGVYLHGHGVLFVSAVGADACVLADVARPVRPVFCLAELAGRVLSLDIICQNQCRNSGKSQ